MKKIINSICIFALIVFSFSILLPLPTLSSENILIQVTSIPDTIQKDIQFAITYKITNNLSEDIEIDGCGNWAYFIDTTRNQSSSVLEGQQVTVTLADGSTRIGTSAKEISYGAAGRESFTLWNPDYTINYISIPQNSSITVSETFVTMPDNHTDYESARIKETDELGVGFDTRVNGELIETPRYTIHVRPVTNSESSTENSNNSETNSSNNHTSSIQESSPEKAPIVEVVLPDIFTKERSKTTELSELTLESSRTVKDFTIDNVNIGTITFPEEIDLSSDDLNDKFGNLDQYITIKKGSISLDTDSLDIFQGKKAYLTMYDLNLITDNIKILHDGEQVVSRGEACSDISYDEESKTLSFCVNSFSKYEIAPNLVIDEDIKGINKTYNQTIDVKGSISDKDAVITLYLNDEIQSENINIDPDGTFSCKLNLSEGENKIKLQASSYNGVIETQEFNVKLLKRTSIFIPIIITITSFLGLGTIGFIVYRYYKKQKKAKLNNLDSKKK